MSKETRSRSLPVFKVFDINRVTTCEQLANMLNEHSGEGYKLRHVIDDHRFIMEFDFGELKK